jgi:hypothetical protein
MVAGLQVAWQRIDQRLGKLQVLEGKECFHSGVSLERAGFDL